MLLHYLSQKEYKSIGYKVIKFMGELKFGLGENTYNQHLADSLMYEYLRKQDQEARWEMKNMHQLLEVLAEDVRQN